MLKGAQSAGRVRVSIFEHLWRNVARKGLTAATRRAVSKGDRTYGPERLWRGQAARLVRPATRRRVAALPRGKVAGEIPPRPPDRSSSCSGVAWTALPWSWLSGDFRGRLPCSYDSPRRQLRPPPPSAGGRRRARQARGRGSHPGGGLRAGLPGRGPPTYVLAKGRANERHRFSGGEGSRPPSPSAWAGRLVAQLGEGPGPAGIVPDPLGTAARLPHLRR